MSFRRTTLALLAVAVVAACSSEKKKTIGLGTIAVGMAKAKLAKRKVEKAGKPATTTAQAIPLEALKKYGRPVIYVNVPRLGSNLPAIQVAKNGAFRTYLGGDKASVTMQDGVITATRGQPTDLFAQELSLNPAAIFYGGEFPKAYTRTQRHLNGEGKLVNHVYTCVIAPLDADETLDVLGREVRVRKFSELCKNSTRAFENSYWIDRRARQIWKSYQSISKDVGHMILKVAIP